MQDLAKISTDLESTWNFWSSDTQQPQNLRHWFFTSGGPQHYFNLLVAPLNVIWFFSNFIFFIFTCNLTTKKKLGSVAKFFKMKGRGHHPIGCVSQFIICSRLEFIRCRSQKNTFRTLLCWFFNMYVLYCLQKGVNI